MPQIRYGYGRSKGSTRARNGTTFCLYSVDWGSFRPFPPSLHRPFPPSPPFSFSTKCSASTFRGALRLSVFPYLSPVSRRLPALSWVHTLSSRRLGPTERQAVPGERRRGGWGKGEAREHAKSRDRGPSGAKCVCVTCTEPRSWSEMRRERGEVRDADSCGEK